MRSKILVALCLVMAACSPGSNEKSEPTAPPPAFAAELTAAEQLALPAGSPITIAPVDGGVRLTGTVENPSPQLATEGASVRIDPRFERDISGQSVRVTIRARSTDGGSGFSAVYSTAEVGNSGWRTLPLTPEYADTSFDYQVPAMQGGNNDYIGIVPSATGSVDIASVRVELLSADTALRE